MSEGSVNGRPGGRVGRPTMSGAAPDLVELCLRAVGAAGPGEEVEAFGEESRRTHVRVRDGEVESLTFADSRGVGVRLIGEGRVGYAYAADPDGEAVGELVRAAGEGARSAEFDAANGLPTLESVAPIAGLFRERQATADTASKVARALEVERAAVSEHPDVRRVEAASFGDSVARLVVASSRGGPLEYARTDCWVAANTLAERDGETRTGFSFDVAREAGDLDWERAAREAATRAARLLGAVKPPTGRMPVVMDPVPASAFLGVLSAALSAEAVQKGRSLFAGREGEAVGGELVRLIDDGRLPEGPSSAPFDDEGVATGRTLLVDGGVLRGFLHNTYTATRGKGRSTGNAARGGYRTVPGVAPSNLFLEPGTRSVEEILRLAGSAVYV